VIARRGLEAKEKVTIRQETGDLESNRETEWVDAYTSTWYPNTPRIQYLCTCVDVEWTEKKKRICNV
jgi:hypothetical protein